MQAKISGSHGPEIERHYDQIDLKVVYETLTANIQHFYPYANCEKTSSSADANSFKIVSLICSDLTTGLHP